MTMTKFVGIAALAASGEGLMMNDEKKQRGHGTFKSNSGLSTSTNDTSLSNKSGGPHPSGENVTLQPIAVAGTLATEVSDTSREKDIENKTALKLIHEENDLEGQCSNNTKIFETIRDEEAPPQNRNAPALLRLEDSPKQHFSKYGRLVLMGTFLAYPEVFSAPTRLSALSMWKWLLPFLFWRLAMSCLYGKWEYGGNWFKAFKTWWDEDVQQRSDLGIFLATENLNRVSKADKQVREERGEIKCLKTIYGILARIFSVVDLLATVVSLCAIIFNWFRVCKGSDILMQMGLFVDACKDESSLLYGDYKKTPWFAVLGNVLVICGWLLPLLGMLVVWWQIKSQGRGQHTTTTAKK